MIKLWMGTDWATINSWLPQLWDGLVVNLQLTAITLALGVPLGLIWAVTVRSRVRGLRYLTLFLVEVGRGAPALVLLQFFYAGLPQSGLVLSSMTSAIIGLAWSTGAYTSEIIRGGLEAVPAGQGEASQALNLSDWDTFRYVILPQGFWVALPALLGFAVLVFQGTSLCFAIALPEIMAQATDIGATTFRNFAAYALTGGIFAAICIPASLLVGWIEHKVAARSRR
ncbi:amino acid ABC transporter permease [Labrys neptuniae]|uniref:Amino acid ABC transporter permease n=1 Tax=Labrys neptuniae TaxID=376174 RepID=A0ABV3PYC4_9HYPH